MSKRILLAHALLWPNVARLARSFRDVGAEVSVLARAEHPVHHMEAVSCGFVYRSASARACLQYAIERFEPDLIIPCDDRALDHMRSLRSNCSPRIANCIDNSIGERVAAGEGAKRAFLDELARLPGVQTPEIATIRTCTQLRRFMTGLRSPVMLKLDGSWGGRDLKLVDGADAARIKLAQMRMRRTCFWGLKRLALNSDWEAFVSSLTRTRDITAQAFVEGRPANLAMACWRGKVVASIAVEAIQTVSRFGVASVVRLTTNKSLTAAAAAICARLNLSGLHGVDFVLTADGQAYVIEINLRATQTCHLPLGAGHDLPAGLLEASSDGRVVPPRKEIAASEIALFPQEWARDQNSPWFRSAYHDLPLEETALMRHYRFPVTLKEPTSGEQQILLPETNLEKRFQQNTNGAIA